MRRLLPLLLAAGLSTPVASAQLTPEHRAVPMSGMADAAWSQDVCCVASAGDGFVAAWYDERTGHGLSGLYGAHLSSDGISSPATGIEYFHAAAIANPVIASDGTGYVVAARFNEGTFTRHLDHDGQPLGDASLIDASSSLPTSALASNGHGYLLVSSPIGSSFTWIRLDAAGLPAGARQTSHTTWIPYEGSPLFLVTTSDGSYHALFETRLSISSGFLLDVTIDEHDNVTQRILFSLGTTFSVVSMGNRLAVASVSAGDGTTTTVSLQLFDTQDQPTGPAHTVIFPGNYFATPAVAYDGSKLLIGAIVNDPSLNQFILYAVRFTSSGDPIDTAPFPIASNARSLSTATGNGKTALVWSASRTVVANEDVYARLVGSFDELVSPPVALTRMSNAPAIQRSPVTALLAGRRLTVWREGDINGSIKASLDGGTRITIAPEGDAVQDEPDVAVAGDTALIVWRSRTTDLRIVGTRLRSDGTVLDATPLVIAEENLPSSTEDGVSVATDGRIFAVAWAASSGGLSARRVSTAGTLLDPSTLTLGLTANAVATNPRALWTGSAFVFVFVSRSDTPFNLNVAVSRMTPTGQPIDSGRPVFLYNGGSTGRDTFSAAASGSRAVVAWEDFGGHVQVLQFSADAPAPQPPPYALTAGEATRISVVSRGDTFLVAWSTNADSGQEVLAELLDQGASFLVAPADAYDVAVMPTPTGFAFTYARTDPDAGNVAQLFTRDLVVSTRLRAAR